VGISDQAYMAGIWHKSTHPNRSFIKLGLIAKLERKTKFGPVFFFCLVGALSFGDPASHCIFLRYGVTAELLPFFVKLMR
jgi:hypothetical protein